MVMMMFMTMIIIRSDDDGWIQFVNDEKKKKNGGIERNSFMKFLVVQSVKSMQWLPSMTQLIIRLSHPTEEGEDEET